MGKEKGIDKRESLRVVTSNDFITASGLEGLSLNARKLLYIAIAQCKINDSEFYEYETTPSELSQIWGVNKSNIYDTADQVTDELLNIIIKEKNSNDEIEKTPMFSKCIYSKHRVLFKLHKDTAHYFLGNDKNFSKPLMWDFMRMRSPYSMAVWHLMQKEMHSFKPSMAAPIEFDVTLEELREVTGSQNKLKGISNFKERILDKALDEIRENCFVDIKYDNIKQGRNVIGFRFTATNMLGTIDMEDLSPREKKLARKAVLVHKKAEGTLTGPEYDELIKLQKELEQMTLEDIVKGY